MKALVKSRAERGLWLEEIDEPAVGINDVLVRVRCTGICETDVHIYEWDEWAQNTIPIPMAIGHEFVGEVVEVGANVNDFFPGNIVSGEGHVVCGRCRNCLAGRRHLCASTLGVGLNRPGAFAELISLPMTNIWRHSPGISEEVAAILTPSATQYIPHFPSQCLGGRAHYRSRPHRHHGDSGGAPCRRAARCPYGFESLPPRTGAKDGCNSGSQSPGNAACQDPEATLNDRRLRCWPLSVGQSSGATRHDCQHEPRRQDRHPRHSWQ
jgi:hypothetical protein